MFYAIGSDQVSSGTFSGVVNGALFEADLSDSARRVALATSGMSGIGASGIALQLKNSFDSNTSATWTPWMRLELSRTTSSGTGVTVNAWAYWWEEYNA